MLGKKQSTYQKTVIRNLMTGSHPSVETREKMRLAKLGRKLTKEHKQKIGKSAKGHFALSGEKHPLWKADSVGKRGLHYWVERHLGKPKKCEHCGTKLAKRFEWANKSGNYLRVLTDWLRLCPKCHRTYDRLMKNESERQHKIFLFPIFREVLTRNNVVLETQKEIWSELEHELKRVKK